MPFPIDLPQITFADPQLLWLLTLPAVLIPLWLWQLASRRGDIRRLARRLVPVKERHSTIGDLPFWLCLVAAAALFIVAAARPAGLITSVRQGGIDIVILQDGSASMRVKDVAGDRWQRSVRFLRTLADAVSWNDDRVALALFAHIAAPQVRLTKDPNTFLFFLDHLDREPPFMIDDETTWDTNLEMGVHWGMRLIERDNELHGRGANGRMFVMISDGETWSGEVAAALKQATTKGVPLYVVGVGTLSGGALPLFRNSLGVVVNDPSVPTTSRLDRAGLQKLASAGGGQYFELDRDGDRQIANRLVDAGRKLAPTLGVTEAFEDFYWRVIAAAAALVFVGFAFLRDRAALWLHAAGAAAVLFAVSAFLR